MTVVNNIRPGSIAFFSQPTVQVARELIGAFLIVQKEGHERRLYRIVETEAYTNDDPACHSFGHTAETTKGRGANLFKRPGLAYVYLIYGMYHCLNVVTEPEGVAGAVLFRGLESVDEGLQPLQSGRVDRSTAGPGKLCKVLDITTKAHNGIDLCDSKSPFYLAMPDGAERLPQDNVIATTRIGIKKAADYPWRFVLKDSPWVSVKPK